MKSTLYYTTKVTIMLFICKHKTKEPNKNPSTPCDLAVLLYKSRFRAYHGGTSARLHAS